jgi:asparagine N-glycosylation enzyme membrane subunit Stt3
MNRVLRIAAPSLFFLAAVAVRILSWHSIFQRGGVYPNGNDAYYHFRRIRYSIDNFPDVLEFDPLINFPHGAQPIWPPTFDWLIAALLRLVPGIDQPDQLEQFAVWIPPVLGAATVVIVYFIALRFLSRAVAIMAAVAMVILPAHVLYSRLGSVDHHVLVAGIVAVMLWLAMALFRDESPEGGGDGRRVGLSMGLGLSIVAAVLVWPGSLLQIGVLQIAMVTRLVTATEPEAARIWALRFSVVHLVAGVAVYPMSAGNDWQLWGAWSPVVLSDFQPLYFFSASACFGFLCSIWWMGWGAGTRMTRVVSASAIGSVLFLGLLSWIPDLGAAILDAPSWFTKDEEFQAIVAESAPLFGGRPGSARALAYLGGFVYVVPLSIVYFAWQFRHRAELLLLIWWAFALFLATLLQWRFMNSYSIAHCLLIGLTIESTYQAALPRLTNRRRHWLAAVLGLAVLVFLFAPPLKSYRLHFKNLSRSLRGEETVPVGNQLRARFVVDAARFLRDHSPPHEREGYSVLGPWGDGHILKYIGERAVVQDNFGDDVAPGNFKSAENYFAARSESDALEFVSPMRTRYVLVRSTGSGHSHGYAADSQFIRLYQLKGSRGYPPGRRAQGSSVVDSLRRHRLIYQSAPRHRDDPKPYCMLFEIVAGAELVGRADPGAVVTVSLVIQPRSGRKFTYSGQVLANAAGEYAMRLPYSNEPFGPDVRSDDHYTIRAGGRSVTLIVPESAVQDGTRVVAPSLGS